MESVAETVPEASAAISNPGLAIARPSGPSPEQQNSGAASAPTALERRECYWPAIEWLPVQISISLPIPRFRVRDLLALDAGQVLSTDWPNGDDLPLSVDPVQLAWVELESVEQEMAVRITRLL